MKTQDVLDKMPEQVIDTIENIRKDYNNATSFFGEAEIRCKLYGYVNGLRDAGLITEAERRVLFSYGTI